MDFLFMNNKTMIYGVREGRKRASQKTIAAFLLKYIAKKLYSIAAAAKTTILENKCSLIVY